MNQTSFEKHFESASAFEDFRAWVEQNPKWAASSDAETVVGVYRFYREAQSQGVSGVRMTGLYQHLRIQHQRSAPFSANEIRNGVKAFLAPQKNANVEPTDAVPNEAQESNEETGGETEADDAGDDEHSQSLSLPKSNDQSRRPRRSGPRK